MKLIREPDLAAEWELSIEQFRVLRRRHGWSHVRLSRQDIRYTEAQVEQIVRDMTTHGTPKTPKSTDSGLTARSRRAS
jgi:hypothetical protein